MRRKAYTYLLGCIALLTAGCITNDIPYPVVVINVLGIEGEGFTCAEKDIDAKERTVTLHLDEQTDISRVKITKASLTEGGTSSVLLTDTHDLRTPIYTTLTLYQSYPWEIRAEQQIARLFEVENQVGAAEIDAEAQTVHIKVSKAADLSRLHVLDMKLGPGEITRYSPTLKEIDNTSFVSMRYVDIAYHDFVERWKVFTEITEQTVSLTQVDAWTRRIWLYGEGLAGQTMGFRYRKSGETAWTDVEDVVIVGGSFSACLRGLSPATAYDVVAFSGEEQTPATAVTTDIEALLPNGGFEEWSIDPNRPKLYYPYTDASSRFWDTGNMGATAVGGESISIPAEPRPGSAGEKSAKLQSKVVVIKFAAGNLFVGQYMKTIGTNGVVGFGQPFTQRPTALRGWVKFSGGKIDRIDSDLRPSGVEIVKDVTPENAMIYVALGNWTPEKYGVDVTELGTTTRYGTAQTPIAIYTKEINSFFNPNSDAVIAYGEKVMIEDIAQWTQFNIPIDYKATNLIPTHIVVVCSASRWGDYFIGCSKSVLQVDDFELIYD